MTSFKVSGMTCGHCAQAVTNAIRGLDAGATVEVDLKAGRVTVHDGSADPARIAEAITGEGYVVERTAA